jgi:uncharacterized repeat protein (TIGR01451 family)
MRRKMRLNWLVLCGLLLWLAGALQGIGSSARAYDANWLWAGTAHLVSGHVPRRVELRAHGYPDGSVGAGLVGKWDGGLLVSNSTLERRAYQAGVDLAISKTVNPSVAAPGEMVTYTLAFSNAGTGTATSVVITDQLPISVTDIQVVNTGAQITRAIPAYVWEVDDLPLGQGGEITMSGRLAEPLKAGTFTNTATIACQADSNAGNNSAAVAVTVTNEAPVIDGEAWRSVKMDEDGSPTPFALSLHAIDANGDDLNWSIETPAIQGTASVSETGPSQAVGYAPTPNYHGADSFVVGVSDGSLADLVTVTVAITPVNDAPAVINPIADVLVTEGSDSTAIDISEVFTDVDVLTTGDQLTLSVGNSNKGLVTAVLSGTNLTLDYNPHKNGSATVTVTATDVAGASARASFMVTVTPVNDPPAVINPIADVVVYEDSDPTVIGVSEVFTDVDILTNGDRLTLSAESSNRGLVTAVLSDTYLTLHYQKDQNGTGIISMTATDKAGASAEASFTVTVNPVNDPPSFSIGGPMSVTLNEDADPWFFAGWATDMSAGPNESSLVLTFMLESDNRELFRLQPAVSGTGGLGFTLARNANGSALITVTLRDDGGTENGGRDTSDPQFLTITVAPVTDERLFVKGDATGNDDGSSWVDAWTDLARAVRYSSAGEQIWIAAGTYMPTKDPDRDASFQLKPGVALYGGLAGNESQLSQRNLAAQVTTLSGDIGTLDVDTDNVYHVVTASTGVTESAVLDGFVITGGYADGSVGLRYFGGGMCNDRANPTIRNITFQRNYAASGGAGMDNESSNPTLLNVVFTENHSHWSGGGMRNDKSNPTLVNVTFSHNIADWAGGGMRNFLSSPSLVNVLFDGNEAVWEGGGMRNFMGSPSLVNVLFTGNEARQGGGMSSEGSNLSLVNVTFGANSPATGKAMYNLDSHLALTNCIVWGDNQMQNSGSTPVIGYSLVQAGYPGIGNIHAAPQFVLDPSVGPDGVWGTVDDDYGDLRLLPTSPAIDAGDNSAVPPSVTTDLHGHPRLVDIPTRIDTGQGTPPIVDMGAYEAQLSGPVSGVMYLPIVLNKAP